jgi:hypothetical protein
LDNSGENNKFKKMCVKEGLDVQFKYTSPHTPQYSGRIEKKFATLHTTVWAILNRAGLNKELQNGLWTEAGRVAGNLENAIITLRKLMPSYNQYFGKERQDYKTPTRLEKLE